MTGTTSSPLTGTPGRHPSARLAAAAVGILALLSATSACSDPAAASGPAGRVSVVGFSVMKTANARVIADFQRTGPGKGVTFTQSYGASGDQARAVIAGLGADEVHLSLEPDVSKLTEAKLVTDDWKAGPDQGILTQSVVVMVVRKGNPQHIAGWDDLVKPGVEVVTPNPGSSGSAKWNILAAYGHVLAQGGTDTDAQAYLKKFLGHVAALPGSGKDATTAFSGGTGDVLLSYENEAIEARQSGADFDYVVPPQTLLIQNPVALTKDAGREARSFLDFQLGKQGQSDYARQGFRPLDQGIKVEVPGANDPSDPFPVPARLLTIDEDFGGWSSASTKFFDDKSGIVTVLLAGLGQGMSAITIPAAIQGSVQGPGPGGGRVRPARGRRSLGAGSSLGLGISMIWFSLLVLIPLVAVLLSAAELGPAGFWAIVSTPQTGAALRLTVAESLGVTALNVVMGTALAWVLVRDRFWGRRLLDLVIDVPFALPTIVAGLVLLSLYGPRSPLGVNAANTRVAVFLALAFVTLPFVVRTVQPVLETLERDAEEAAASLGAGRLTTFRRVILPSLVPAVTAGAALSFARGLSEYGSLVLLSGNLPGRTEVASVRVLTYIENGNKAAASAVAAILLLVALTVIVVLDVTQRKLSHRGE